MIKFVLEFITRTNFPTESRDDILNATKKLALEKDFIQQKQKEYASNYSIFDFTQTHEELSYIAKPIDIPKETAYLIFYILLTKELKTLYVKKRIDLDIFENTVLDLLYKSKECKDRAGYWGLVRPSWYARLFTMQIIALGRLQFEPKKLDRDICKNGISLKKDDIVLNVHIPSSGKLLKDDCIDSFNLAKEFFKDCVTQINEDKVAFICNTWLLFPRNREYLNEKSSILMFMEFFTIYDVVEQKAFLDAWRVFGRDFSSDIVPKTSLQKEVYAYLLEGNKLGEGKGFFVL